MDGPPTSSEGDETDAHHPPRVRGRVPRRRSSGRLASRPWIHFLLALLVLSALLVLVRGNLLWTAGMQNPDEAELMAEGRTAAHNLFPYSGYTSEHPPVPVAVRARRPRRGWDTPLARDGPRLSGLAYVFVTASGWFVMMRRIGAVRAALFSVPPSLVLLMGTPRWQRLPVPDQ